MSHFWALYRGQFEFAIVSCIFAMSLFVGLWSGVLSVAPIAFASASAFVTARVLFDHPTASLPVLILIGVAVASVLSYVTSYIFLRLSSHYLALGTIALVLISRVFVLNLDHYTGGTQGIAVTRMVTFRGLVVALVVCGYMFARLRKSRIGLNLQAMREQPEVTASLGVNIVNLQRFAFVLAGALGGLAGVLQSQLVQYLTPDTYYVDLAFVTLAAVVLGGAYHWFGTIVGSAVYAALPEVLDPYLGKNRIIANGLLLLVIMLFFQRGLVDPLRPGPVTWWKKRRASANTTESGVQNVGA